MEPTDFKEQNAVFAKQQGEYKPLPAFKAQTREGEVVTCWKLSFRERLRLLFTGKIWLCQMTFNHPLQPQCVTTKKSDVLESLD